MILKNFYFQNIVRHNKKYFSDKSIKNNKCIILVEFHNWSSSHICYSYLLQILKKKYNAKILAYEGYNWFHEKFKKNIFKNFRWKVSKIFGFRYFGVYKSFGVENFIDFETSVDQYMIKAKKILSTINKKKDLVQLKINNILIGDLIYDSYLKKKQVITINLTEIAVKKFILNSIILFYKWDNYLTNNPVKSIVISHSTYLYGLPMRIAISKNISVYKPTLNTIYNIKKKNYSIGEEFYSFPAEFNKLDFYKKEHGLNLAKIELKKINQGKSSSALGYKRYYHDKFLNEKKIKKIKIMVALHNFYDSPNVYGNFLFSDFYEWLKFLIRISLKTNYTWYIKLHPENTKNDLKKINDLIKYKKNIKILPSDVTHNNIFNLGIEYVITCFGSIGYEYAYKNITVINCCQNNPHAGYDFNLNPSSIKKLEYIILNLKRFKLKLIDKNKIYEFLFVRRFLLRENWLHVDKSEIQKGFGWKKKIYQSKFYDYWIKNFHHTKHHKTLKTVENFIESNSYKLNFTHSEKKNENN